MMPRSFHNGALALAAVAGLALLATGCASSNKKVEQDFPKVVDTTVTATQSEPDKIEYIDVKPWSAKPGDTVDVTVKGTKDRKGSVSITGLDGQAAGKTQQFDLAAKDPGTYVGSFTVGDNLPPGRYRIEGTLAGGPSGEPVKLVSSRTITVEAPPPPPPKVDACMEAKAQLAEPQIHFAYDKSDLDPAAATYVTQVAQRLAALGSRVTGVTVVGHCDERGTVNYNLALGSRRANAVKNLLAKDPALKGLKIDTLSKGKEEPLNRNAQTEEEHAANRRAVFVIECTPAP